MPSGLFSSYHIDDIAQRDGGRKSALFVSSDTSRESLSSIPYTLETDSQVEPVEPEDLARESSITSSDDVYQMEEFLVILENSGDSLRPPYDLS